MEVNYFNIRTLFIIPEIDHEIICCEKSKMKFYHLKKLEYLRAKTYQNMNSENLIQPNIDDLIKTIKKNNNEIDELFNPYFGSLFRNGIYESSFSMQVNNYADLYRYFF
jgi:hypothetical protein